MFPFPVPAIVATRPCYWVGLLYQSSCAPCRVVFDQDLNSITAQALVRAKPAREMGGEIQHQDTTKFCSHNFLHIIAQDWIAMKRRRGFQSPIWTLALSFTMFILLESFHKPFVSMR